MKQAVKIMIAGFMLWLSTALPARANIDDIRWSDTGIELDGGLQHVHAGQDVNNNGSFLGQTGIFNFSNEAGNMPSVALQGGVLTGQTQWAIFSNLYLHLDAHYSSGSIPVNSSLITVPISGNFFPDFIKPGMQESADEDMYSINTQIGHAFPIGNYVVVIPFVDIGYQYWDRKLTGIYGYRQDFSQNEVMAGPMIQITPIQHLVLTLSGEAGTTVAGRMWSDYGNHSAIPNGFLWQFDGKIGYAVTNHLELTTSAQIRGYDFGMNDQRLAVRYPSGQPNTYLVGSFPISGAAHEYNTLVGLAYHF
jgi:hypothetical protein